MEPVRIKLYGLIRVTRRAYLFQLGLTALLLAVLFVTWYLLLVNVRLEPADRLPRAVQFVFVVLNLLPYVVPILAGLFAIEAVLVLRQFARAEAARKDFLTAAPPRAQAPPGHEINGGSG